MGTAAKLNSENQNNAATLQLAEIPEKYRRSPELRKIKRKGAADIKKLSDATGRNYKHRGVSNNGTRHTIPQNEENLPEPGKIAEFPKNTRKMWFSKRTMQHETESREKLK